MMFSVEEMGIKTFSFYFIQFSRLLLFVNTSINFVYIFNVKYLYGFLFIVVRISKTKMASTIDSKHR